MLRTVFFVIRLVLFGLSPNSSVFNLAVSFYQNPPSPTKKGEKSIRSIEFIKSIGNINNLSPGISSLETSVSLSDALGCFIYLLY